MGGQCLKRPEEGVVEIEARGHPDYLFRLQLPVHLLFDLDDFNLLDGALVHCLASVGHWSLKWFMLDFTTDRPIFNFFTFLTLTDPILNIPKVVCFSVRLFDPFFFL